VVAGRRLFKDRRERDTLAADPSRSMRELEASLSSRMSQLESKVEAHTHHIQDLGKSRDVAEERFMKLIGAMETFWSQAPRQLAAPTALALAPAPEANTGSGLPTMDAMAAERPPRASRWWKFGLAVGGAALVLAAAKYPEIARQLSTSSQAAAPVQAASVLPVSAPGPISTPAPVEETPAAVENPAIVTPAPPSPAVKRATETEAPRNTRDSARAGMIHQVSLEVPAEFRSEIDSPVTVDVNVSIDPQGKVTNAAVSSTKGTGAELLTPQALKAARWFRFQPTRKGNKAIASEMILSFVFEPEAITPVAEER
jgi:TonB family protein